MIDKKEYLKDMAKNKREEIISMGYKLGIEKSKIKLILQEVFI